MFDEQDAKQYERKREYDRSRLVIDVHFDGGDATGVASTKDISLGGLYMNTKTPLPEGTRLKLRVPLNAELLVVDAEVVYSQAGRGVGVRFIDLTDAERNKLEGALAEQSNLY